MTDPQPVDWQKLLWLRTLQSPGEPDVIAELISTFLDDAGPRMRRLREAAVAGDARTVAFEAHALKGSASLLAAEPLRAAAERVELAANETIDGLTVLLEPLAAALGSVERAVARLPPAE